MHVMCKNWVIYNTKIQYLYLKKYKNFLDSQEISFLDLETFSFHFSLLETGESDFHFTFHLFKGIVHNFFIFGQNSYSE